MATRYQRWQFDASGNELVSINMPFKMCAMPGTPTRYTICTERCQIPCTYELLAKLVPSCFTSGLVSTGMGGSSRVYYLAI